MIDITNDALAVEGTTGCNLSCTQAFLTPDGALWPFSCSCNILHQENKDLEDEASDNLVPRAAELSELQIAKNLSCQMKRNAIFCVSTITFLNSTTYVEQFVHLSYYVTNYMFVDRPTSSDKELEIDISLVKIFVSMNSGFEKNLKKL